MGRAIKHSLTVKSLCVCMFTHADWLFYSPSKRWAGGSVQTIDDRTVNLSQSAVVSMNARAEGLALYMGEMWKHR